MDNQMKCPKCNGTMRWDESFYTDGGMEVPAHWSCINCGKIVEPGRTVIFRPVETIPKKEEKMTIMKICTTCHAEKSIDEFSINRANPDGHEYRCKACWKGVRKSRKNKATVENNNSKPGYNKPPAGRKPPPPPAPPPVSEALYIDPTELRALIRGVGKKLLQEFARFLEERYA